MNLLNRLTDWDKLNTLTDFEDDDIGRRIVFSNVIYISLPIVYLIFMIIDYDSYLQPINELNFDNLVVPIEILICILCLFLNKIKLHVLSRVLFLITWPFLLHLIPIKLQHTPEDYYLALPFGIVFHTFLVQLMISYRKETLLYIIFMLINFVGMVFAGNILLYFEGSTDLANALGSNPYYRLDGVLYWLLFNLTIFYVIYLIELYIKSVNSSRILIREQKEEIEFINKNLESIIQERTEAVENQNKQLKEYAFYNAHNLRGPFAKIKGLMELIELIEREPVESREESYAKIREKLNISLDEMEEVIENIQKIVEREQNGTKTDSQ